VELGEVPTRLVDVTETNFLAEDLDNRLLKERIVFLAGEVRDERRTSTSTSTRRAAPSTPA